MCTFDIVPSLGPQSQVLHPVETSFFIQSSIPSTRFAIDTHHKYLLLNYSSTKVPIRIVLHPPQVLVTHYRCSQDCAQHTIRRSRSEDQRKGSARPCRNLITISYMWRQSSSKQGLSYHIYSQTQISLIVAIAYINSLLSMGIKEYGK